MLLGRLGEAAVEFESAAEAVDPPSRGRPPAEAAMCRLGNLEQSAAAELATEAVSAGEDHGDAVATAIAGYVQARIEAVHLRMDTSLERARAVIDQAGRELTGDIHRYQPLFFCGLVLVDHDRLGEATVLLNRVQQLAERGRLWVRATYHGLAALVHLHLGGSTTRSPRPPPEWPAARRLSTSWRRCSVTAWWPSAACTAGTSTGPSRRWPQPSTDGAPPTPGWGATSWFWPELGCTRPRATCRGARSPRCLLGPVQRHRGVLVPAVLGRRPGRLATALGRTDRAEEVTAAAESSAQASGLAHHRAAALYCRGLVDDDPVTLDAAFETPGKPPHPRSGPSSTTARVLYERAGATGDAGRLESEPPREAPVSPSSPWDRLTPRELEVVKLVAARG